MTETDSSKVISDKTKRLFERVPRLGDGWRWYDVVYRICDWLLNTWPRWLILPIIRRSLQGCIRILLTINQHERNQAEELSDRTNSPLIAEQVRLRQGGLWAIELFPPSKCKNLTLAIRRNGWEHSQFFGLNESNSESVRQARDGRGNYWWSLITVAGNESGAHQSGGKHEDLPPEFESIDLVAVQLGSGVTAVVAFFKFSESGESSLSNVWSKRHEPVLAWRRLCRPIAIDRYFSTIEATQKERLRLHTVARRWMARRCPGFFASRSDSHPVMDLNLFDGMDPTAENKSVRAGLRALGMANLGADWFESPELPGAVLIPTESSFGPHEPLRNCWAIAGDYQRVVTESAREGSTPREIGYIFNETARSFVLYLAVMQFLQEQRAVNSAARDLANIRHRKFTIRWARNLSGELLESGLDLPAMARDSRQLWSERHGTNIEVQSVPIANSAREKFDLIKFFEEHSANQFRQLLEEDENYRTVLSTAAALGASTESALIGRRALFLAGCSMGVAALTLLIAQPGDASLWSTLIEWIVRTISSWWASSGLPI